MPITMKSDEDMECHLEQWFNTAVIACNGTRGVHEESYQFPLIQTKYWLAVVYIALMALAIFLGTFGNVIILVVSIGAKTTNRVGRSFIINLAVADFCISTMVDPLCIFGVVKGEAWFDQHWWLCQTIAAICMTGCFCAFTSLTMLTVNRYIFICHNYIYNKIYTNVVCALMCILCWVIAFLFELPVLIGWASHYFDQKSHQCTLNRHKSFSYAMFLSIALIGGLVLFMAVLYVLIFRRIWVRKFGVYSLNKDDPFWLRKARRETLRSSKTLFVVFLVFTLCWTPYVIVSSIDITNSFSEETYLFTTLAIHYHSSLNCIVYILFKRSFWTSFLSIVGCYKG